MWLKRDLCGKLHYTENTGKSLKFFSALLRMGKRALRCAGCKAILGWITRGGSKVYIKNIDSGRIYVKGAWRLTWWTPKGTIVENKVTFSIKAFWQFYIPARALDLRSKSDCPFHSYVKADNPTLVTLCLGWPLKSCCKEQLHLWLDPILSVAV